MKVIVVGAGRVGYGIAGELSQERNAVTVVDLSSKLIEQITTDLDVRGVVGNGAHPEVLDQAGARDAEMIIAATFADEVNMVACHVAHALFEVPNKIARVRAQGFLDPAWSDLFSSRKMPIDVVISPEAEVARSVLRRLETPGAFDTMVFANGLVNVLGIHIHDDCPVVATPLPQLSELFPHLKARAVGVRREGKVFVPKKSDMFTVGDDVYLIVDAAHRDRALEIFGRTQARARRVVIVGGGNIGVYIARELEQMSGVRVRVVEADKARAEAAATALQRTVVLHGDGLDAGVLREAGVAEAELVITLTNNDKVNVLAAALGKHAGVNRALCLINDRTFQNLKGELQVDAFIDPRATTVSTVLKHVRKGRITGLQSLEEGDAEIVEGVALETSPLVGKSIKKAGLGPGIAVGAVIRGDRVQIPDGDFVVEPDDRVILFAERDQVGHVEKVFRVALEYF